VHVTPENDERAGVAVIRAWVDPAHAGEGESSLRARVITVEHGDSEGEQEATAAGVDDVLALVREFLTGLTQPR
jgi:hypothetical protein